MRAPLERAPSPRRTGARGPATACRGRARAGPARPRRRGAWRVTSETASSATLSRPGFLAPPARRPWSARSSCLRARLVPRSAPLIEAWRRSRSARLVALRARPARGGGPTPSTGRTPSVGTPDSSASSSSARAGSVMTSPLDLEPDRALLAAVEPLGEAAVVALALLVLVGEGHARSSGGPPPSASHGHQPVEVGGGARDLARERELDRALDASTCRPRWGRGRRSGPGASSIVVSR